ncbi:hypothetical protein FACS1894116_04550 [Betaproteobacteria bacterium]|nr:hypothetical protein FACS1894116_04550 [Betaproteobacteria bacterium]GHT97975.1 hypothetical protein FACS1894154_02530 [Betaproteobacteria bacterium]GHU29243.1 hypothetical protein FACS189497_06830 [Betaproteobacteria bacterium]
MAKNKSRFTFAPEKTSNYAFKRTAGDTTFSNQALSARQPLDAALDLSIPHM